MSDNRTTELREKLTERGIEYTTNDHMGAYETSWDGFTAMQLTPGAKLMMVFTPEQAIAATLGSTTHADRLLAELNNDRRINKQLKMANALLRKSEAAKIERIKALESLVLDWAMAPCAVCDPWDEYFACEHFDGDGCTLGIRMAELGIEVGE